MSYRSTRKTSKRRAGFSLIPLFVILRLQLPCLPSSSIAHIKPLHGASSRPIYQEPPAANNPANTKPQKRIQNDSCWRIKVVVSMVQLVSSGISIRPQGWQNKLVLREEVIRQLRFETGEGSLNRNSFLRFYSAYLFPPSFITQPAARLNCLARSTPK
jgi:hypothetical protein